MFHIIRVFVILLLHTVYVTSYDPLATEFPPSHNKSCRMFLERVSFYVKRIDQITNDDNFHSIVGSTDRPLCHALYSHNLDNRTSIKLVRDFAHDCETALKQRADDALASDMQENLNKLAYYYGVLGSFANILLETRCDFVHADRRMHKIMKYRYDNAVTCLKYKIFNPPRKLEDTKLVKQCNTAQKRIFKNLRLDLWNPSHFLIETKWTSTTQKYLYGLIDWSTECTEH